MNRTLFTFCLLLFFLLLGKSYGDDLNTWISSKIVADEQLLEDAFNQRDGHSLELLQFTKTYVPCFLEKPSSFQMVTKSGQDAIFDKLIERYKGRHLPGGYVYRIKFKTAPPLYAISAGEWNGRAWHSIAIGKDIQIEPGNTWESSNSDYLYTTFLAGTQPQIIIYNQGGEVAHQETFDASAVDFDERLRAAIAPYASSDKPGLEMISLAEYLKQPDAAWRAVDINEKFNLRNQHQRPDEQERLKQIPHLTRSAAVRGLTTNTATAPQLPRTDNVPPAPKRAHEAVPPPTLTKDSDSTTPWKLIVIAMLAAFGLLCLLLKRRS